MQSVHLANLASPRKLDTGNILRIPPVLVLLVGMSEPSPGEGESAPSLASSFKACRKAAALTQEQAAEAAGVSVHTLRAWETGTMPPASALAALAPVYGCTVDELLGGSGPAPGHVLVDEALANQILALTPKDGERGVVRLIQQNRPGPIQWIAVVPDDAVWLREPQARELRDRVVEHLNRVAPKTMRRWGRGQIDE